MPPRGGLFIPIVGDERELVRALERAQAELKGFGSETAKASKTVTQRAGDMGRKLTGSLTPAAAGLALFARTSFKEFDTGMDALRAGTGATGQALQDLGASMKTVAGQVTQPISEVGRTMADLQTRTGLVGKPLEELTLRTLQLARVTGGDAQASVEQITRVFGDWGVAAADQSRTLDMLFRASQATGPSVERIGELMVKYGSPLRQMGFGFDQTAALMGKFEKEGVNTELVMGSLRIALGKMARAGEKDLPKALERSIKSIKNAGSAGEANAKALEIFGARAGPDMAAAIREGRFELGDLFQTVSKGEETIASAQADTLDLGDRFTMLKNKVMGAVGPMGEIGTVLFGTLAAIGPVLMGLGQMGPAISGVGKAFSFLAANPIVLVVAALVGLALVAFKFRDQIGRALGKVRDFFVRIFGGIRDFLARWKGIILPIVLGPVGLIIAHWSKIKTSVVGAFRWVKDKGLAVWDGLKAGISRVADWLGKAFKAPINLVIDGLNWLIRQLNKIHFTIPDWVPKIGGKGFGFNLPEIQRLAAGGIVRATPGGILANIGEGRHDEAVIPLRRSGSPLGMSVTIVVQGSVVTESDLARRVRDELVRLQRRNATTGLA